MTNNLRFIRETVTHENAHMVFPACDDNTILDFVLCDPELNVPRGYAIQMSATKDNHFARPYAPTAIPFHASDIQKEFVSRDEWEYDFCYLGSVDTDFRRRFFEKFQDYMSRRTDLKFKIVLFDEHFLKKSPEEREGLNEQNEYERAMRNSRFALCPQGHGLQTIRFYEAMSVDTIPIHIGPSQSMINRTKLPLDWIIQWDRACVKMGLDNYLVQGWQFDKFFDDLSNMPVDTLNGMREYVHGIYRDHLVENEESRERFRQLVRERIGHLRNCQD